MESNDEKNLKLSVEETTSSEVESATTPKTSDTNKKSKSEKKAAVVASEIASKEAELAKNTNELEELRRLFNLRTALNRNAPKTEYELQKKEEWKFWETQPVPQLGSSFSADVNEAIEPNKPISEVNPNKFSLPAGFRWDDLDLNENEQLMELYTLLNENYVEDDDNMFRLIFHFKLPM
jgi:hypothetical protein